MGKKSIDEGEGGGTAADGGAADAADATAGSPAGSPLSRDAQREAALLTSMLAARADTDARSALLPETLSERGELAAERRRTDAVRGEGRALRLGGPEPNPVYRRPPPESRADTPLSLLQQRPARRPLPRAPVPPPPPPRASSRP